ncbi:MAG: hypothetical protein JRF33_19830 [Deltaproteobacteria bacterium]|nr:hypothetical protein [Deltaproteobacteria bacterium]
MNLKIMGTGCFVFLCLLLGSVDLRAEEIPLRIGVVLSDKAPDRKAAGLVESILTSELMRDSLPGWEFLEMRTRLRV